MAKLYFMLSFRDRRMDVQTTIVLFERVTQKLCTYLFQGVYIKVKGLFKKVTNLCSYIPVGAQIC